MEKSKSIERNINIFYIGADEDFSRNSAGIMRVVNNCKAINHNSEFNIKIIGYGDIKRFFKDDFEILNTKRGRNTLQKLYYFVLRSFSIMRLLKVNSEKPDVIIYYGTSFRILYPLLNYCKTNRIKLLVDVVEWYKYSNLPLGKYGPFALGIHLSMTKLIPKCDGVIAISTFLQNYFKNLGMKTVKVPILISDKLQSNSLVDMPEINPNWLNLIYAGLPGRKDLIMNVIKAVDEMNKEGFLVKLHLLGPTKDELEVQHKCKFSRSIVFYGKIPQNLVHDYLKRADFSVLLRPNERYANAGFPTKFVESLNVGLPVIANLTSDLSRYLIDGYNGFIVPDDSVNAFISVMKNIILKDKKDFREMRINAKNTATYNFNYPIYSQVLSSFILDLLDENNNLKNC